MFKKNQFLCLYLFFLKKIEKKIVGAAVGGTALLLAQLVQLPLHTDDEIDGLIKNARDGL